MARITAEALASHIAAILDGDWDDGLEAYVAAMPKGGGEVLIDLAGDGSDHIGTFRFVVEQIS